MKKYHFHPDNLIIITNENKIYIEKPFLAKFDAQKDIVYPIENSTEFQYVMNYGTKNFNKGDMISFNDSIRPELDFFIENIDLLLQRQKVRGEENQSLWEIPEDMRVYTPPTTTTTTSYPDITTTEVPNVN